MSKKIKIVTLCSGYDSQCMALDVIKQKHPAFDYELVAWSEIDKYAIYMHNLVYPQYADRNLGDMTNIDWKPVKDKYGEIDFLTYSTPCQSISQAGLQHGFEEVAARALLYFGLPKKPYAYFARNIFCRKT